MSTIHRDAKLKERLVALTTGASDVWPARCTRELVEPLTDKRRPMIHAPFLRKASSGVSLGGRECLLCIATASSVLRLRELVNFGTRLIASGVSFNVPGGARGGAG